MTEIRDMNGSEVETARQWAEEVLSRTEYCPCHMGQMCWEHDVRPRLKGRSEPDTYEARYVAYWLCARDRVPEADIGDVAEWSAIFAKGDMTD